MDDRGFWPTGEKEKKRDTKARKAGNSFSQAVENTTAKRVFGEEEGTGLFRLPSIRSRIYYATRQFREATFNLPEALL